MKLYGPYTRQDGRMHVIWYDPVTKYRRTQSYPRYLMEQHLGRELEDWEHVDHINENISDNRIENLQILTQVENNKKSSPEVELYHFECPACGLESSIPMRQYKQNQIKQKKSGPYCSKSCAASYTHW